MANTSAVYARIDTNLKENAEGILAQLGISPSSAIQMLYSQIVLTKGLPLNRHESCRAGCRTDKRRGILKIRQNLYGR